MKINLQVRIIVLSDNFNNSIVVVFNKFGCYYVLDDSGDLIVILVLVLVASGMLKLIGFPKVTLS